MCVTAKPTKTVHVGTGLLCKRPSYYFYSLIKSDYKASLHAKANGIPYAFSIYFLFSVSVKTLFLRGHLNIYKYTYKHIYINVYIFMLLKLKAIKNLVP